MKQLKGTQTLRLLSLEMRRFNPLPDDLSDTPAVLLLTLMSDRTLSRRRSYGTIPYV